MILLEMLYHANTAIGSKLPLPDTDLEVLPKAKGNQGLWIDPINFLRLTNALAVAAWAIALCQMLKPRLPKSTNRGRPELYSDASILLTSIVAMAWHRSMEDIVSWIARYSDLALVLGYPRDSGGSLRTICLGRYSERLRALGLLPYFLFFVGMVYQLIRLGAIKGKELVLDSSLLKSWYHRDIWADWSYPSKWKGHIFGYKIHAVICRQTCLPVFFVVTPANISDGVMAIGLLAATVALYGFKVGVVWADAAYWNYAFLGFVRRVLGAVPVVDYNMRRKGKKFLATLFFVDQWRRIRAPRTDIERYFARAKRYFGLKYFQMKGLSSVTRHAFLVNICILAVAMIAIRHQRSDWALSRSKVLAFA